MADQAITETTSYKMSKIRSRDTKPELLVRSFLHSMGLRFRLHNKKLPGKPDLVLKKFNTVVFINGCFWHGHDNCKIFTPPKTRAEWWKIKIGKNKERDKRVINELLEMGWKVLVVWECELKANIRMETLNNLYSLITSKAL